MGNKFPYPFLICSLDKLLSDIWEKRGKAPSCHVLGKLELKLNLKQRTMGARACQEHIDLPPLADHSPPHLLLSIPAKITHFSKSKSSVGGKPFALEKRPATGGWPKGTSCPALFRTKMVSLSLCDSCSPLRCLFLFKKRKQNFPTHCKFVSLRKCQSLSLLVTVFVGSHQGPRSQSEPAPRGSGTVLTCRLQPCQPAF